MAKTSSKSVDEYIASQPDAIRDALTCVRSSIRKALPKAEEVISYNIPTYKLDGKAVIYFAGWKHHFSLYPISDNAIEAFHKDFDLYQIRKSTLRFSLSEPVPAKLIERIAKFRAKEIAGRMNSSSDQRPGTPAKR